MSIPILTYHSVNIAGNDYAANDHVALAADLRLVTKLGWRIAPLHRLTRAFLEGRMPSEPTLALTFDDGSDFDFHDLPHPAAGPQRSLFNILHDFSQEFPEAQPDLHATAFVIVSPDARRVLDRTCLIGKGWWNEYWWQDAARSGLMGIANHSWDHVHTTLDHVDQREQRKGDFGAIDCAADADAQVVRAFEYIETRAPNSSSCLFAYPYGHVSGFLSKTYFNRLATRAVPPVIAAFGLGDSTWSMKSDRWNIPRWVCGDHWKHPDELAAKLAAVRLERA